MISLDHNSNLLQNASTLKNELEWLDRIIEARFNTYFQIEGEHEDVYAIPPPDLSQSDSIYARVINHYEMGFVERVIVLLALAPHVCPQLLDRFFIRNERYGRGFSEFGGIKGQYHSGFLPTGETATFVLAANDLGKRFELVEIFSQNHYFYQQNILSLNNERNSEPELSGLLTLSKEFLTYFTSGANYKPKFSSEFPAKKITTKMEWEDLILEPQTLDEVLEIQVWLKHFQQLLDDQTLGKMIKPGYRSLFYGPPGTGKNPDGFPPG